MSTSGLPRSTRKFIRTEKSRIRGQFFDVAKQQELIADLYKKFSKESTVKEAKEASVAPKQQEAKKTPKASAKKEPKAKSHEKKHNKA